MCIRDRCLPERNMRRYVYNPQILVRKHPCVLVCMGVLCINLCMSRIMMSVSYTHLDVYKRQAIQIGVSIAAVALFDMIFVSTLVSTAITTVRSTTDAFFPCLLYTSDDAMEFFQS